MLGIVAGHYELDWREADRRFRLAMAREPISSHRRLWYALFYLFSIGRAEEARWEVEPVLKEDPLSQMWHWALSEVLRGIGRNEEALSAGRKAVEIDPQFWAGWMWLGLLQAIQGRSGESRNCAEKAIAGAPWSPYCIGLMAGVPTNTGESEKAEALLANLRRDANGGAVGLASYHLVLGEFDRALEWSRKAVEQRLPTIVIIVIRAYAPLFRELAGCSALLKKDGHAGAPIAMTGMPPAQDRLLESIVCRPALRTNGRPNRSESPPPASLKASHIPGQKNFPPFSTTYPSCPQIPPIRPVNL